MNGRGRGGNHIPLQELPVVPVAIAILCDYIQVLHESGEQAKTITPRHDKTDMMETFMRWHPLSFGGDSDPEEAGAWLAALKKLFQHMRESEREKVRKDFCRPDGEPGQWWHRYLPPKTQEEIDAQDWLKFKDEFLSRFFPNVKETKIVMQILEKRKRDIKLVAEGKKKKEKAPLCLSCGNPHFDKCKAGMQGCFNCGSLEHKNFECPWRKPAVGGPSKKKKKKKKKTGNQGVRCFSCQNLGHYAFQCPKKP